MKKIFALTAAVAMLAACESQTQNGGGYEPDFTQAESKVYVDVTAAEGWAEVSAWAWTEGGENYTIAEGAEAAAWPGVLLTETEEIDGVTYIVWNAPAKVDGIQIGFIVSAPVGEGREQTADLKITPNSAEGVFVKLVEKGTDGKWLASINGAEVEKTPIPTDLNTNTWAVSGSFNVWSDTVMTVADGWATADFTIVEEDTDKKFKVRADGSWAINYGAVKVAEGEEPVAIPVDGTEFTAEFNGGDIVVTEAGNYTLSFSLNGEVATFKVLKK